VRLLGTALPNVGDQFRILPMGVNERLSGTFATLNGLVLPDGDTLVPSYGNDGVTLTVQASRQVAVTGASITWAGNTFALNTMADGLRLIPIGRNTDLPWNGLQQFSITLSAAATLSASDITAIGATGTNYGPVTVTGSGTTYTITFAQPISQADRVTVTIQNANIITYARRLDVLPGDVNDDGVVNVQDVIIVRNMIYGFGTVTIPIIFGDINGDGAVDLNDFSQVRQRVGTMLPPLS